MEEVKAAPQKSNVVYPIPLRDGEVIVRIHNLPDDLTREEAERIAGVIASLVSKGA